MSLKLAVILSLLSLTNVYSQISQSLDIEKTGLEGQYRLTGYVNTLDTGLIEFWAIQIGKDGQFIRDRSRKREIGEPIKNWRKLTLTGKIQRGTTVLKIGIWCMKTIEKYNIDNVGLEVNKEGTWRSIEIKNGDFELPIDSLSDWTKSAGYSMISDRSIKKSGEQSLSFTKDDLLKYGNNKEHGAFLNVNGINIYYETYGSGEPILLLHGNNESIISFNYQIDALRNKYKVIAVDSRGQGNSSMNKIKLTYEQLASDMNELLNTLSLDSVNILGWSDGGNTGLIMAMNYPKKVKSLITMGANLYPNKDAVQKKFLREYKWSIRFAKLLAIFNSAELKDKVRIGKMPLNEPNINPQDLNKITSPVLVMAGEKDVINESHTRLIASNISGSKLVILKELTHYAPQEDPKYFNREVDNFLSQVIIKAE